MKRKHGYFSEYYSGFEPTRPIETEEGLKARSQRGSFVKNWWANRWIDALERLMDSGRLTRGRSYARRGQVLSIDETKSGIEARVQGSRPKPYKVSIQIEPLDDVEWERVLDMLSEQALFTAQLLAGEMPQEIEQAFSAAGVSLFPASSHDLTTNCSCPDWANPCKHIAATYYLLGERFDEDPFLLFRLRGRNQEQILQALRERRAGLEAEDEEEEEVVAPLESVLDTFWDTGSELEQISISIRPPSVEMPLLKRLGDPNFVPDPGLQALIGPALRAISQAALESAFSGEDQE